nr:outer membrane protein assembly factor BamB [Schlegelella koreensis]
MVMAAGLVAGCGSSPQRPAPRPLAPLGAAKVDVRPAWNQQIGPVQFPLVVAVNGNVATVAASDGSVHAIDADSGRALWRANVGAKLGAGVGSDGRSAAVVTQTGELVVLENGSVKWRRAVGARVATPPLVAGERVFVLAVDRSVHAFDGSDGHKLWSVQRPGDPLNLLQAGVLLAVKDTLVVGQGPRLAGLDPSNGGVRWEAPIGSPRGANEVERLADLVGPVVRAGDVVCARSFQAAVGCVDADRGVTAWARNVGGTDAVGGDATLLFGADASDRMTAWRLPTGDVAWTSESLLYRGVGAPAAIGGSVVYGDEQGTLHWLARDNGEAQQRLATDGSPIQVRPAVVGSTLIVVTRNGGVYAFRSP